MPLPVGFPPPTEVQVISVKQYPEYRAVTYTHTGAVQQASQVAFNPLYQHISSNNIAMTTPVEVRYYGDSGIQIDAYSDSHSHAEVSFLYADPTITPRAIAPNVKVTDYPAMTVVSIGIAGAYTWESYQTHLQALLDWLSQHSEYKIVGEPRRFLYNSPMTPEALKRSEVQIPIELH
ncbi:heme-binding protein [Planktothricoides raciborskii]|uniref:Heme-binding protein n=1 Tax=Planktothricoides raciborskii GIHE-MW2 TaxID=2792601 RepID=A0AAU8JPT2_9CYAN